MFSSGTNYTKLKTNLRLAINRLKLIGKKKVELTQKTRQEIADYIGTNKVERAKIRVEYIIREDYLVEAMEIVEMYCDLILARFGLVTQMKNLDEGLAEAISSVIWVAPRLQSDIPELKVISDLFTTKYGKPYTDACRAEQVETISEKLKQKMSVSTPPKILVEKYLIEIAKKYFVEYEPDPNIMKPDDILTGGADALIDFPESNNLGRLPQPAGFIGFPQPPTLPPMMQPPPPGYVPFNYPAPINPVVSSGGGFINPGSHATTPNAPPIPHGAPLSYNIPPNMEKKDLNTNSFLTDMENTPPPTYDAVSPDENLRNMNTNTSFNKPKPQPRSKMPTDNNFEDLPELPSVPSDMPNIPSESDDIDFDDLARRFEELKRKK